MPAKASTENTEQMRETTSDLEQAHSTTGFILWLTGLRGAGKTTIARAAYTELLARGLCAEVLDADEVRRHLSPDLGFNKQDRDENVKRLGYVANLLASHGVTVLVAAISPYRQARDEVRAQAGRRFIEIHVSAPLYVCERRDPKGLYRKARRGEIKGFTGIDDPYEEPLSPEIRCNTDHESLNECVDKVISTVLGLR